MLTCRDRSHSPRALAWGSKRVLAATPSPSSPWISTLTPCEVGQLEDLDLEVLRLRDELADPVDRHELAQPLGPLRRDAPPRAPTARRWRRRPCRPTGRARRCRAAIRRVMALVGDTGDRVGGRGLVLGLGRGLVGHRRIGDDLGRPVGEVHGVLDGVAVDVRRSVDAVRRRGARRGGQREARVRRERELDRRSGERLADRTGVVVLDHAAQQDRRTLLGLGVGLRHAGPSTSVTDAAPMPAVELGAQPGGLLLDVAARSARTPSGCGNRRAR